MSSIPSRDRQPTFENRVVGVFRDHETASDAARAVQEEVGIGSDRVEVGGEDDLRFALRGEMREELNHTVAGPGPVGPYTKEMTKGLAKSLALWTPIGAVVALPFAFVDEFFGLSLAVRLLLAAIIGAVAGATVALAVSGGLSAKGPAEPMAAERGETVGVIVDGDETGRRVAEVMARFDPIRVDTGLQGRPTGLVAREPEDEKARRGKLFS